MIHTDIPTPNTDNKIKAIAQDSGMASQDKTAKLKQMKDQVLAELDAVSEGMPAHGTSAEQLDKLACIEEALAAVEDNAPRQTLTLKFGDNDEG